MRQGLVVQLATKWGALGLADPALRAMLTALRARGATFIGAPAEAAALRARFADLPLEVPPTTRAWIATIDRAAAVVSVDTGTAHLAGMLGVPIVDVFPDAQFEAQTRRWRPWAAPASCCVRASWPAPRTRWSGAALDAL